MAAPIASRDAVPSPRLARAVWAFIALATVSNVVAYAYSSGIYDTWRDLFFAEQIVSGRAWPWQGPVIGNIAHLGPLWFYLIAPAYLVGGPLAVAVFVGVLASAKFVFAWRLGLRFGLPHEAAWFVLALALPGWAAFEPTMFTHTSVVASAVLAMTWCAARLRDAPSVPRAIALAVAAALAVHAHPTTLLVVAACGLWALSGVGSWRRALAYLAIGVVVVTVSIAPLAWHHAMHGFDDAGTLATYASEGVGQPVFARFLPLVRALFELGPMYALGYAMALPVASLPVLHAMWWGVLAVAAVGLVLRVVAGRRAIVGVIAIVLVAQMMFVLALRPITPVWMTWTLLPPVAALLALGFSGWSRWRGARVATTIVAGLAVVTSPLIAWHVARHDDPVASPRSPEGTAMLMDVIVVPLPGTLTSFSPRTTVANAWRLGEGLCTPTTLYGHYALFVEYTYGVGARHHCGDVSALRLGGAPVATHANVAGLTTAAMAAAGCAVDARIGDLAIVLVHDVWSRDALPWFVIEAGPFPPRTIDIPPGSRAYDERADADDLVMVTARAPFYFSLAVPVATANGVAELPVYEDPAMRLYRCVDCARDAPVQWQLEVTGSPAYTDVVRLGCDASPKVTGFPPSRE